MAGMLQAGNGEPSQSLQYHPSSSIKRCLRRLTVQNQFGSFYFDFFNIFFCNKYSPLRLYGTNQHKIFSLIVSLRLNFPTAATWLIHPPVPSAGERRPIIISF
jgi:hypothetical protein